MKAANLSVIDKVTMEREVEGVVARLKRHEGLMLKPYLCPAGKLTVGYGHNLESKGITKKFIGKAFIEAKNAKDAAECLETLFTLTEEEAEELL